MSERQEEDYFSRIDREKMEKIRTKLDKEKAVADARARQELHWHKCGKCGNDMTTVEFRGVEVETCRACGAVLLDNGELEQLAGQDQSGLLKGMFGKLFPGGS